MPRRRTIVLGVAAVMALAAILIVFALRDRRIALAPTGDPDPVAEIAPAPRPPAPPAPSPPPGAPRVPERRRSPPRGAIGAALDEASLMTRLRGLEGNDPALILELARQGNAALPDSPDAPERAWMVVKSLASLQRFKEAHDEAQTMVNRYPGTSWSLDVQRHLLSNPLD